MSVITSASIKQVGFINTLLSERVYSGEPINFGTLSSREASDLISLLISSPRHNRVDVGMYQTPDGEIYRVQPSRETGNLYAKHMLVGGGFEYERGAISRLTPADKMTLEQAKAWGMETGVCCVCGAFLTDEKSVQEGIGPVCAKRL
jgi:hypothetical protein